MRGSTVHIVKLREYIVHVFPSFARITCSPNVMTVCNIRNRDWPSVEKRKN